MPDISSICHMFSLLPLDCLKLGFMQQALLAVLLLTPMTAALGVEVISFRMAFFSDAIGIRPLPVWPLACCCLWIRTGPCLRSACW